jgi:hypothetical protein
MESPPLRASTPPEAEVASRAARVSVTASAMPKGPKQQPPEPEWIGDGESTSTAGEGGGPGENREKTGECAGLRRESRGPDRPGPWWGHCACVPWGVEGFAPARAG